MNTTKRFATLATILVSMTFSLTACEEVITSPPPTTQNLAALGISCDWVGLSNARLTADGVNAMGMFVCENGNVINGDELYVGDVISSSGNEVVISWHLGPYLGTEALQVKN